MGEFTHQLLAKIFEFSWYFRVNSYFFQKGPSLKMISSDREFNSTSNMRNVKIPTGPSISKQINY